MDTLEEIRKTIKLCDTPGAWRIKAKEALLRSANEINSLRETTNKQAAQILVLKDELKAKDKAK